MELRNVLPHKRGTKVMVNGTVYDIDGDGMCKGLKDEDAAKLLGAAAWEDPKAPKSSKDKKKPQKSVLLDSNDNPIEVPEPAPEPEPEPENDPGGDAEPGEDDPAEPETEDEVAEGEEWPEPTEEMELDYLREMADAYEVSYTDGTRTGTLVKRIKKAMYE